MRAATAQRMSPIRVLIVDDERDNRELLEIILERDGFETTSAASGEEALLQLLQTPPDIALLDIMMPGMNGYQLATAIRADPRMKSVRMIMVTALDDQSVRARALDAGAADVLKKPIDRVELCRRIREILDDAASA